MTRLDRLGLTAALVAVLLTPSCRWFRRTSHTAPPPVPSPSPTQVPPSQTGPHGKAPAPIPQPPEISPPRPDLTQLPPAKSTEKLPPPPRRRVAVKSAKGRETPETQPAATEPAQSADEAADTPVPQLEQILTPEQRQAYAGEIDTNIGRAQKMVDAVQGKRLSNDQQTELSRIRAFIEQAREARGTDLLRAKNLAERASVLAEDLSRSVQ